MTLPERIAKFKEKREKANLGIVEVLAGNKDSPAMACNSIVDSGGDLSIPLSRIWATSMLSLNRLNCRALNLFLSDAPSSPV